MLNRVSLNTIGLNRIGLNRIGKPSRASSDRPYIDPEVLASLKAVCICYGKSNDDPDRAVVKNLVDPDNPFVISNAAFKLNSGFGKYEITFQYFPYIENVTNVSDSKVVFGIGGQLLIPYSAITENIPSFKIKVSGLSGTYHFRYYYRSSDGVQHSIDMAQDGYYELPICYNVQSSPDGTNCGFANNGNDVVTITQIPSFEGAFVTDGIDDLITSTKTVQEMLRGSSEYTVLSMIHHIDVPEGNIHSNTVRIKLGSWGTSNGITSFSNNKTGIYGYTVKNQNITVINNILGDKNDYGIRGGDYTSNLEAKFSVVGWIGEDDILRETASIAWYWTIIANKVLTTDQINQVIAYFNLDRTLNPDILCDIEKQGITNENHAEFGDKLIDFSGNGRDIQLNNIAWKGDSGIGKYATDFTSWLNKPTETSHSKSILEAGNVLRTKSATSSMKVKVQFDKEAIGLSFRYFEGGVSKFIYINSNGEYSLPPLEEVGVNEWEGFSNNSSSSVTITQIPSHAGALCLDGINDFGKVTGMPVYKDYTIIADYERFYLEPITGGRASILSKSSKVGDGSFIFNLEDQKGSKACYTFGEANGNISDDITRIIRYQSKYYNTKALSIGTAEDNDFMVLGKVREVDNRYFYGAIYSLMSFPYSMSEFLIERQLKKHKLGTLYPDMVEFRPIIKSNASYDNIVFYYKNEKVENGTYLTVGSSIGMHIRLSSSPVNEIKSITVNGIPATFKYHDANNNIYQYDFNLTSKSPQNINITIDEYIRYEDIVQPYPVLLRFNDENGNEISWGDKIKVGSSITRIGSFDDCNLLKGIYTVSNAKLNGSPLPSTPHVVERQMVFTCNTTYLLDNNEPKVILSPRLLSIPNSSYKILGHIPDISGHGNNGVINNSAYAEGSGVNEDGSYQFDGVDDFITIPTLSSGGKQMLMKVNWNSLNHVLYDQRNNAEAPFCIVTASGTIAYNQRNVGGNTYIDGILNNHILVDDLQAITHNIVLNNDYNVANSKSFIGTNYTKSIYAKMLLYDFMLFDEISTDDKIKELNEYVGIEGDVWGILTQLSNSTLISNETLIKNE